jgi:hypothetical protein
MQRLPRRLQAGMHAKGGKARIVLVGPRDEGIAESIDVATHVRLTTLFV